MPENALGTDRLDSWKEIAAYLGRDVRTVIRWEARRGLPVHRLPGGQVVFAYKSELDEWLKQGPKGLPDGQGTDKGYASLELSGHSGHEPAKEIPTNRKLLHRLLVAVGILIATTCGLIFVLRPSKTRSISPLNIRFTADSIEALDEKGRVLWTHTFATALSREPLARVQKIDDLVRFADLYHDGTTETIVAIPFRTGANPNDVPVTEIDCFSNDGKILWSYVPQEKFRFGTRVLEGPWLVWDIFVSSGKEPVIWAAFGHHRWGNSFVVQLDPKTGRSILRFVNTGTLYKLNETQIAGNPYLLIGGFNNEYAAGILAIVDERKSYAVSPQTAGTRHKCIDCPEGAPDYYFVLPRSEINQLRNLWEDSVRFISVQGDEIEVDKAELWDPSLDEAEVKKVHVIYDFHTQPVPEPFSFRFDSAYDILHQELQNAKKLDHSLDACPERLHPQPVRVWTPLNGWNQIDMKAMRVVD